MLEKKHKLRELFNMYCFVICFNPKQNSEAMVSIDMPAGPSEVLVIADRHASPVHIAADLLSQVLVLPFLEFLLHPFHNERFQL